jgi:hypothetical protein
MFSFSHKGLGSTTVARRLFVAIAGLGPLFVAYYRAPTWLDTWNWVLIAAAIGSAAAVLVLAIGVAVRGSAGTVKRVAVEITALGCALLAAEAALLASAPDRWSDDPLVQRMMARERAAREHGIAYDGRLRADVVRNLESIGVNAAPGFAQIVGASPAVSTAIRARGLLPLSNISNSLVVECNEGAGFFKFRSDELGFNNPPGLVSGAVDVAVIGESLALGHCVPPSTSAVDLLRARFPRTANFAVAGSRVLSQLGLFREYVEPIEPPVVVWFVNPSFALARAEASQPILLKYLNDSEFTQGLRTRQDEVDSFVREVLVPLNFTRDEELRTELADARYFPLARLIKLRDIRGLVELPRAMRRPPPAPDLSHFERAVDLVVDSARGWGGTVILVILPSYQASNRQPTSVARYEGVLRALEGSAVIQVDGVALFAAQADVESLYSLGIDNHPSERGHELLADAIIAAIERHALYEPRRISASH